MDFTYQYYSLRSGRTVKKPVACELSPGEQLVLIKENLRRAKEYHKKYSESDSKPL
jgi:hypothetical protein